MTFDATFWVAVSFLIFVVALIYLKVPGKINELLANMITSIKKEIDESEKLRAETRDMLDEAQKKLDSADKELNKILKQAKNDSEKPITFCIFNRYIEKEKANVPISIAVRQFDILELNLSMFKASISMLKA